MNERIEQLDKQLKELRKELESDLAKYRDRGWLNTEPLGEEFAKVLDDNFWEIVLK